MSAPNSPTRMRPQAARFHEQWWRAQPHRWCGRVVRGLYPAQVREHLDWMHQLHHDDGTILLVLDAAHGFEDSLVDQMLESYLAQVGRRTELSAPVERLAEALFGRAAADAAGQDGREGAGRDALLARLWTLLARQIPATLVVLHPDLIGANDRQRLEALLSRVFADPVAELAPDLTGGLDGVGHAGGTFVLVGDPQVIELDVDALGFECVDAAGLAPAELRDYLGKPDVLARLVESTGGSLPRLRALLDELPDDADDLLMYRYERLAPAERDLLAMLAAAETPVPARFVDADTAERLLERGFVHRRVDGTRVALFVAEPGFARRIVERTEVDDLAQIYARLAEMAAEAGEDACAALYGLRAGAGPNAVVRAVDLAERQLAEGDIGCARRLLEEALEAARPEQAARAERLLIDVERAEDNPHHALLRCEAFLGRSWEQSEADGRALDVALIRAELLLDTGDFVAATGAFDTLLADAAALDTEARLRARWGRAETAYLSGDHAEATSLARSFCEMVADTDTDTDASLGAAKRDRWVIRSRNLLGKLAIYAEDYAAAREHFEAVRRLAGRRQWVADICRAEANLGIVAMQVDDVDTARAYLEHAAEMAGEAAGVERGGVLLNLAMLAQRQARFEQAFGDYAAALESASQAGNAAVYYAAAYNLATLYQDVGAFERALQALAHLDGAPRGPVPLRIEAFSSTARAGIFFEQQRYAEALGTLRRARERFDDIDRLAFHGPKEQLQAALAHLELGEAERARDIVDALEASQVARVDGLATLVRARLARHDGEADRALELARRAWERLSEADYHHGRCLAAELLLRLLEADGRIDEAYAVLDDVTGRIHQRAEGVPDAYRDAYFDQPIHRSLLGRARGLRALDDEAPAGAPAQLPSSRVLAIAHEILEGQTSLREQQRRLEHECIRAALERTDGNITQAAELLQLNRSRLSQIINADEELSSLKQRLKG